MSESDADRFAPFVATLGRGPGKSRPLTREEAAEAFGMVLAGRADPMQVGAFLMLLRYRGEDADEISGLVEAARVASGLPSGAAVAELDWPSYGAGRTRGAPWFVLSALALARSGVSVLMHGSNDFSAGQTVQQGLAELGIAPVASLAAAEQMLRRDRFAYLPIAAMAPALEQLLGLRRLFGLRSPVNTVARLLNPGDAPAGVDGVFHPAYLDVHMGVAERLGRPSLIVLKGGGGEAERNPAKPAALHVWRQGVGRTIVDMPAYILPEACGAPAGAADFGETWRSDTAAPPGVLATIQATIALGLLATGRSTPASADADAATVWSARH
jgi:anthranilate phosphoribosyltransferase